MNTTDRNLKKQQILYMLQSGRSSDAKTLCTDLCRRNQGDPDAWFILAAINAELGQYEETISACGKVIALDPDNEGARYNLGLALQLTGRLDEAAASYRELISLNPAHIAACNNLGQVLRKQGNLDEATEWFEKAIAIDPGRTDIWQNMGLTYLDSKNPGAAASIFSQILAADPDNYVALINLGLARHLQSRHPEAIQYIEQAIDINPDHADAHNTLANIYLATGDNAKAFNHFRHAVQLDPDNAAFHYNLGNAYQVRGKQPDAIQEFRIALSIHPGYTEACNNLGQCLLVQGEPGQAIDCFRQALLLQPGNAAIHHNLSSALWRKGMRKEALEHALIAVTGDSNNRLYRQNFSQIASVLVTPIRDPAYEKELENCLSMRGIDHQLLVRACISLLASKEPFVSLLQMPTQQQMEAITGRFNTGTSTKIFSNRLLQGILFETVTTDARFEQLLKVLRRACLISTLGAKRSSAPAQENHELDFMCALACQCFNNEYIYLADSLEQEATDKLIISIGRILGECVLLEDKTLSELAIACMYTPLYRIKHHQFLLGPALSTLPNSIQRLIKRQLLEPNTDIATSKTIETITPIDNATSQAVRDQYEDLPYPRWLDVNLHKPRPLKIVFNEMFPHFTPPDYTSKPTRILIAGCGSGRHAIITATRFANSEVLAIDLSKSSLAYGTRMAKELGVENIRFAQGDILKLGALEERFDIIESVGVLHHMADPINGLNTLLELLRPSGLINIGLYSKLARRSISATQEYLKERGYSAAQDDMRKAREVIHALDHSDPMYSITSTQDFYSLSEFCDMAFHAHEICYALPEVARILEQSSLQFIGFELSDPSLKQQYKKLYPEDKDLTNLRNWNAFEQRFPDTFLEMYTFWSQKVALP